MATKRSLSNALTLTTALGGQSVYGQHDEAGGEPFQGQQTHLKDLGGVGSGGPSLGATTQMVPTAALCQIGITLDTSQKPRTRATLGAGTHCP